MITMRILLVNQFFVPDTAATGQLLFDVARACADAGHDIHVICSRGTYAGGQSQAEASTVHSRIRVHRLPAFGLGRGSNVRRLIDTIQEIGATPSLQIVVGLSGRSLRRPPGAQPAGREESHRVVSLGHVVDQADRSRSSRIH